jgi:hypothetical protein
MHFYANKVIYGRIIKGYSPLALICNQCPGMKDRIKQPFPFFYIFFIQVFIDESGIIEWKIEQAKCFSGGFFYKIFAFIFSQKRMAISEGEFCMNS